MLSSNTNSEPLKLTEKVESTSNCTKLQIKHPSEPDQDPPRLGFQLSSSSISSELDLVESDTPKTEAETPESRPEARQNQKTVGEYALGKVIGEGAFGKIRLGHHLDNPDQLVAIKIISKKQCKLEGPNVNIKTEIDIMRGLKHPHIIECLDVIDTEAYTFIVMEYIKGGDLFDYIME